MGSLAIYLLSFALCLSSGFQQGYISSVLNQPYLYVSQYINSSWTERTGTQMPVATLNLVWSLLNVTFPIATIFGQFLAAWMCKRFGRKMTALTACSLYIPASLLSFSSKFIGSYFELLFIGRIMWSLANGINSVNATVWIVECAPSKIRGRMAAMQEFFMAIGSLMSQAIGVPFSSESLWPFVFLPNVLISVLSLSMFLFVYESPQYIMEKHGNKEKARRALAAYHGVSVNDSSLDSELQICEGAVVRKEKKKASEECSQNTESSPNGRQIMFGCGNSNDPRSIVIRHAAWLGIMVKIAYVSTGARCLRSYSTFILHTMGGWQIKEALYGSVFIGLIRLPITLVPVFLVDRVGRRPLLIFTAFFSFIALVMIMLGIDIGKDWKMMTLIGLALLLLINAMGIGSVSRFYAAELVPRNLLLSSVSMLTMFEALTKIVVEFSFYPLANEVGATSLLLFLIPTVIFIVLMWALCPETSRRSVNEVLNEIAQRKKLKVSFTL